ncbi:hypothetical protein F5144DRAFT_601322 [Chaetomium tenue]|uniref:Uncharacterized protein n=1 Tax=Chaetomium tenue TaxID=1854479 RepID=A0ACB7PE53_9PEZI|nr:hypothetical protein F5144DRAFT_601322 [Chaetomium globosum]
METLIHLLAGGLQLDSSSLAANFTSSSSPLASIRDTRGDTLSDPTHAACPRFARDKYPEAAIAESSLQGRCSYTLILRDGAGDGSHGTVLQFRPPRHRLDLSITDAARSIFGSLVPETRFVGVISPEVGSGGCGTRGCRTMVVYALEGCVLGALVAGVPELKAGGELRGRVEMARLLGLLLWYGIAFDGGALNRVVEEGRDDEELQKLELFLSSETASIDAADADDGSP